MLKKIGRFFEDHVEKMVLVLVGIISFVLLILFVLRSPNRFEVPNLEGKTETLSPGEIDERILQLAMQLNQKPVDPIAVPDSQDPNELQPKNYLALLDSSIGDISSAILSPDNIAPEAVAQGPYQVPQSIGRISNVAIEHIRAAAYVPTEPVTDQRTYDQVEHEPNDIDLVTVQGSYDVEGLFRLFHERFFDQVPEQWADPNLAKPVFAAVNLQRRDLGNDGDWSDWQNVPRISIDYNKKLFDLVQDEKNMPSSIFQVQRLQFDNPRIQMDLLQPPAYQFASAREEWYPPSIHPDYTTAINKEMQREKQQAKEAEKQQQNRDTDTTTRRGSRTTNNRGIGGRLGDTGGGLYGNTGTQTGRAGGSRRGTGGRRTNNTRGADAGYTDGTIAQGRSTRRRSGNRGDTLLNTDMYGLQAGGTLTTQTSPLIDVYRDFNKIQLTYTTDFSKMSDPLVFWAHDDTVEPGNTYQYRIRLGVFNPVAQSDQDKAIIWSDFSNPTNAVDILEKVYFFANRQDTDKTVTLSVYKYFMGYWRNEDFRGIGPGEAIGGVVKYEPKKKQEEENIIVAGGNMGLMMPPVAPKKEESPAEPESIDFDTGAVVVDVVDVDEWTTSDDNSLSNKSYADMLYSFDGENIEHMAVSSSNWPNHTKQIHSIVQKLSNKEPEPFKSFGAGRSLQQRGNEMYPGQGGEDFMYDQMMMEGMGGMY
jgi:hypothetical protein